MITQIVKRSSCKFEPTSVFFSRFLLKPALITVRRESKKISKIGGAGWSGYISASQSKSRMFEDHHDSCSLPEFEATLASPENSHKMHVILKQGRNSGSP